MSALSLTKFIYKWFILVSYYTEANTFQGLGVVPVMVVVRKWGYKLKSYVNFSVSEQLIGWKDLNDNAGTTTAECLDFEDRNKVENANFIVSKQLIWWKEPVSGNSGTTAAEYQDVEDRGKIPTSVLANNWYDERIKIEVQ